VESRNHLNKRGETEKPEEERKAFSMSDIKTMNHNTILLQRFIDVFGITPYSIKNQKHFKELIYYGTMAA
jgi:hypothetical protein